MYLAFLQAPKCGNQTKTDDPYAFNAREAIREPLIGKLVDFTIEYQINGKKYISILQEESTVTFNFMLVQHGLAKPIDKKATGRLFELIKCAG